MISKGNFPIEVTSVITTLGPSEQYARHNYKHKDEHSSPINTHQNHSMVKFLTEVLAQFPGW